MPVLPRQRLDFYILPESARAPSQSARARARYCRGADASAFSTAETSGAKLMLWTDGADIDDVARKSVVVVILYDCL